MIKSELIQLISSKQPHLSENDVIAAVMMLINRMIEELAGGGRIEIRGFGAFSLKHRRAKLGRNPKTGVAVSVPQKHSVYFKPGTELRARVNDSAPHYPILDWGVSMRLTAKSRYAVTALLDLAIHSKNQRVTLADIAEWHVISLSYLEQLFSRLRKAGLVRGMRGPGGGYLLAKSENDITIAAIIEGVNEPISVRAYEGDENCFNGGRCLVHDLWADLDNEISSYLSNFTLADILAQQNQVRNRQIAESVVTFTKSL